MRYIKMGGDRVRVASTSGHIVFIGDKFVDIPKHMEPEARSLGCVSEESYNQIKAGLREEPKPLTYEQRIQIVMSGIKMLAETDSPENSNFTSEGLPNKTKLYLITGFRPTPEEFDEAWGNIQKELAVSDDK